MTSAFQDQLGFGAGVLVVQAVGGATPVRVGVLQECSINFDPDLKELYGQHRYAIAIAGGKTKASVKAKYAGFRGRLLYDSFFAPRAGTATDPTPGLSTGARTRFADSELIEGGGGGATVINAGTFLADAGVYVKWSGRPLNGFDPTVPGATGDYTVSGGSYSFSTPFTAADENPTIPGQVDLYISYTYTDATAGTKLILGNPRMGSNPVFSAVINMEFDGRSGLWTFPRCVIDKLAFPTKLDDFEMNDFEFRLAQDIGGNLGELDTDL
jgi:hypothetical protein